MCRIMQQAMTSGTQRVFTNSTFREMDLLVFRMPKSSLHNTSCFRQVTIKANVELVVERLSVMGHKGDGLFEALVDTIPNDKETWWRVFLLV